MDVALGLGEVHAPIVILGQRTITEEITFEIGKFEGLSPHGNADMADLAAVLLKEGITFLGFLTDGVFISLEVTVEGTVGGDEGLLVFGDGISDRLGTVAFRIDGEEFFGQRLVLLQFIGDGFQSSGWA